MTWAIFAVLMTVYWVTGRKQPKNGSGQGGSGRGKGAGKGDKLGLILGFLREIVLFTAMCTLVFAPLPFGWGSVGAVVGGLLAWLFGVFEGVGLSATLVATVLLIAAVVVLLWDVLSDREVNRPAHIALMVLPFLVFVASGPVAESVNSVVSNVHTSGVNTVSSVLGR